MSLPVHQLGLLNAWLGVLVLGLLGQLAVRLHPRGARLADASWFGDEELRWARFATGVDLGLLCYALFVPLQPAHALFVPGLLLFGLGGLAALWSYRVFLAAADGELATTGPYRRSRHPIYLFTWLALLGLCAAASSWVLLLGALLWALPMHKLVRAEERHCLAVHGAAYRAYLGRVPRYFF